jgi:predicted DNA-binding protein (UPF0251 family)
VRNVLRPGCSRSRAMPCVILCVLGCGVTGVRIRWRRELPAEEDAAAAKAAEAELAPCLTAMIGRLREPYQTAISLTSLQGLTQAEAATRLGVSISGMKSRVQRGREQLRVMLVRCCAIDVDVRGGVSISTSGNREPVTQSSRRRRPRHAVRDRARLRSRLRPTLTSGVFNTDGRDQAADIGGRDDDHERPTTHV